MAKRKCIICGAKVRNLNQNVRTCSPTCTRFWRENDRTTTRVLRYEDAVRRDIERAAKGEL